jgi:protein-L-isoaspartate(D-aspartate) O-methyltransferase
VWSVERHAALSAQAAENLAAAGVENVTLLVGDGTLGVPAEAPFDAINVAAAGAAVPPALEAQLGPGGRLVAPVENGDQRLLLVRRREGTLERTPLERVRFVPLV